MYRRKYDLLQSAQIRLQISVLGNNEEDRRFWAEGSGLKVLECRQNPGMKKLLEKNVPQVTRTKCSTLMDYFLHFHRGLPVGGC